MTEAFYLLFLSVVSAYYAGKTPQHLEYVAVMLRGGSAGAFIASILWFCISV